MKLIFAVTILFIAIVILIKKTRKKKLTIQIHKNDTDHSTICPNCLTGQESYILDSSSEICPYISCLKNGKCKKYIPIK